MKRGKIVYANLCAECHRKMDLLYVLHDVPAEYARAGTGKCALCDFRGALTACRYDPAADKRTPEETAAIKARRAAAEAPKFRRTEAEREKEKSGAWMRETFERLERISASGRI